MLVATVGMASLPINWIACSIVGVAIGKAVTSAGELGFGMMCNCPPCTNTYMQRIVSSNRENKVTFMIEVFTNGCIFNASSNVTMMSHTS